jgi:phenol/toluene 2-monooxygenase (NADH) P4/A4
MSVKAISTYTAEPRDRVENFHGMQLLYLHWPNHMMYASPFAFLVAPDMTFAAFLEEVLRPAVAAHPDSAELNFASVSWQLNKAGFTPQPEASLIANGIDHKSMLTMTTPGLNGIQGSGS